MAATPKPKQSAKPTDIEVKFAFVPGATDGALQALEPFAVGKEPIEKRSIRFFDTGRRPPTP